MISRRAVLLIAIAWIAIPRAATCGTGAQRLKARRELRAVESHGNFFGPLAVNGADWKIGERLTWSFGVGLGATDTGNQVILKSRIEFEFGRKHNWARSNLSVSRIIGFHGE
jgi:hypothetical protein